MTEIVLQARDRWQALAEAARVAVLDALDALGAAPDVELALVLTDEEQMRELNHRFRDIDAATDVLSFPPAEGPLPPGEPPYLGDVVISVPYAERSAAQQGRPLADELRLLAVHGLLHLLGYEDETDEGAEAMAAQEVRLGVRPPEA